MPSNPAKLRETTSGNKKGRTNVRPFGRSGGNDYFLNGRFSVAFFSGALVVVPVEVGLVHGGFTVGVVGVVGVVGGTPPPPAAAPKRETEAKSRIAARGGVFMRKLTYPWFSEVKTFIFIIYLR